MDIAFSIYIYMTFSFSYLWFDVNVQTIMSFKKLFIWEERVGLRSGLGYFVSTILCGPIEHL